MLLPHSTYSINLKSKNKQLNNMLHYKVSKLEIYQRIYSYLSSFVLR